MAQHRVLVVYATKHGSTEEVAAELAETLRGHGFDTELREAGEVASIDGFEGVLVGGALYAGRWHRRARSFLREHAEQLRGRPVAVFALGPQDLEPEHVAQSRGQLERALGRTPDVRPVSIAIFGGAIDPQALHFPFNRMQPVDARDWDAIHGWGDELARVFAAAVMASV